MGILHEKVTTQHDIHTIFHDFVSDYTAVGSIIDTSKYPFGLYFAAAFMYDDSNPFAGNYQMKIEHGDDPALSDADDVPSEMLVYGNLPVITAETTIGQPLFKEGVHSTKQYIRCSIIGSNSPTAVVEVVVIGNPPLNPV